jgi:Na+-transporting NADH:ubiquinone oxidoreductase subunit F
MFEIGLGITVFTVIVMCLAVIILAARSRLVASGDVDITINDRKTIRTQLGGKLLEVLDDAGINLPSACGGVGTCGLCRVAVVEGGGSALPVESSSIPKRDIARGVRLACQVAVRGDMRLELPDEILGVRRWSCRVRSNLNVASLIKELVMELPEGEAMEFRAGAFIQVTSPPYRARFADFDIAPEFRDLWDRDRLWRYESVSDKPVTRAYSMANYPGEKGIVKLDVRIAIPPPGASESVPPGVVSSYLFSLGPGDAVEISGPYGHFFARDSGNEMVLIGGGVGMAPLRAHILDQLERLISTRRITFWYGARSRRELFYVEEFDRLQAEHPNFRWFAALSESPPEDAWQGHRGFIHQVTYENYLKDHPAPEDCEYYVCGPPVMIKAVRAMLEGLGVEEDNILFDDFGG